MYLKDDFTLISFQRPISSEVITRSPSQFFRGSHLNMDLANVQPKRSYRQPFAEVKSRKNHCWWQPFSKSSLRPQCHRCLTQSMCQTGTYWVFFGGKKHISGKWAARSLASRTGMWTDWACELRTHLTLDYTTAVWQSHCWADHIKV